SASNLRPPPSAIPTRPRRSPYPAATSDPRVAAVSAAPRRSEPLAASLPLLRARRFLPPPRARPPVPHSLLHLFTISSRSQPPGHLRPRRPPLTGGRPAAPPPCHSAQRPHLPPPATPRPHLSARSHCRRALALNPLASAGDSCGDDCRTATLYLTNCIYAFNHSIFCQICIDGSDGAWKQDAVLSASELACCARRSLAVDHRYSSASAAKWPIAR
uniref:Uncharacterized protein n=1 Tax=Oryza rufipogon TaxID=4529 RepID=A0A0E0QXF6_ORYRU